MSQHGWTDSTHLNWVSNSQQQGYRSECTCGWVSIIDTRENAQDEGTEHEREALADLYDAEVN